MTARDLAADFARDGFVVHHEPLVPVGGLDEVASRMDDVAAGRYSTGREPGRRYWNPGDDPTAIVKIDDAHLCDDAIFDFVTSPAIGEFAAQVVGTEFVQLWASQLLVKPPGGSTAGQVGWHRDQTYWRELWDGEVFTVWVAVSDVDLARGPLCYVRGSHRWDESGDGDFFSHDLTATRGALDGGEWDETAAVLAAGGASAHSKLTVHGSAANTSDHPRQGFALHLRTDRSAPTPAGRDLLGARLADPRHCPLLVGRAPADG